MEGVNYTPVEKDVARFERQKRRRLGVHALVFAAGLGFLAEDTYEIARQDQSLTIEALEDRAVSEMYPHTAWYLIPGYNMAWRDSREAAEALKPELEKTGQVHWVGLSNKGFEIDDLKKEALEYAIDNDLTTINLYGYSFGGMVSVELAQYLIENGISVNEIVLDSSPANLGDVKTGQNIVRVVSLVGMTSTQRAAVGIMTTQNTDLGSFSDAEKYASAELLNDTASYIARFSPNVEASGLPAEVDITYIGSSNDERINTESAANKWRDALSENDFEFYDSWPAGHASPRGDTEKYLELMAQVNEGVIIEMCYRNSPDESVAIEQYCPSPIFVDPRLDPVKSRAI